MDVRPLFTLRSLSMFSLVTLSSLLMSYSMSYAEQVVISPDKVTSPTFKTKQAVCYGGRTDTHINLGFGTGDDASVTGEDGKYFSYCTVGGGFHNIASSYSTTVSGGYANKASANSATVCGGLENTASGMAATVCGGGGNEAGGNFSWAGGVNMKLTSDAYHTFVWGYYFDNDDDYISTADAFLIFPIGTPGRVGVGTPSPEAKLEVEIGDNENTTGILIDSNETGDFRALWIDAETTTRNAAFITGKYPMQLIQDISGGYGLYVTRNITDDGLQPLVKFRDDNPSNKQTTLEVRQDGIGDILNLYQGESNEVFTVLANGTVGIGKIAPGEKLDIADGNGRVETGYNWLTNSDSRLKKNISTLEGSLDKILHLRGVRFDTKKDGSVEKGAGKHIGVVAQELEKEYPELVVDDEKTGYKAVAYDKLTAVLIEAIKELKAQNEKQQAEIEELRSLIREQKG